MDRVDRTPPFSSASVSTLMISSQAGDKVAYACLLRDCEPVIRNIALRAGVPVSRVEDVVESALRTLHHARATYDPDRPFDTWLFAIARECSNDVAAPPNRIACRIYGFLTRKLANGPGLRSKRI